MSGEFVKLSGLILLMLIFAAGAAAQAADCSSLDAARLSGLRLGMSVAEAQSVFGKDPKIKVKSSGDRVFFQNYIGKRAPRSLAGVRAVYLRFLDGTLYQIEIFYEERTDAPTLERFVANLSAPMQIPQNTNWQFANQKASIECGTVRIVADKPVDSRVVLTDTARQTEAETRRRKGN